MIDAKIQTHWEAIFGVEPHVKRSVPLLVDVLTEAIQSLPEFANPQDQEELLTLRDRLAEFELELEQ